MVGNATLTFAVAGAGSRGAVFASWVLDNFGKGAVQAVAEPDDERRSRIAAQHGICPTRQFRSWQEMLSQPKLAEVLINATMDREHLGSACAAMKQGYHMLLEKPLATTLREATEIDYVRRETGRIVSVCHSLRYHAAFERTKDLIESGRIGEVVSLDQLEAVEHIHQSHSFVRGNWANEGQSTFMLLAKSCHDIDVIDWLIDRPCEEVNSFGSLSHFRAENAPPGAPKYCVEGCPVEDTCPYHAAKVYGASSEWRHSGGFDGLSQEEIVRRLRFSRYGVCVYQADNDAVDHQVVAMRFAGGVTATFTMTAFTPWGGRYVRVHGSKGYLEVRVDQRSIDMWEFWDGNRHTRIEIPDEPGSHGGGDGRLMWDLVEAVQRNDASRVRTSTSESLRTHRIVFAAEQSRRTGRVVRVGELEEAAMAGR